MIKQSNKSIKAAKAIFCICCVAWFAVLAGESASRADIELTVYRAALSCVWASLCMDALK